MSEPDWSLFFRRLIIPKSGVALSECEDAVGASVGKRRFCAADGATEGFDSRRWARLLVKHWTLSGQPIITPHLFETWLSIIGERFEKRWRSRRLSWFAEEKAGVGAFAAFLGLSFHDSQGDLYWQYIALGDVCLIVRRADIILGSFPLSDPASFGNCPFLVPSKRDAQAKSLEHLDCRLERVEDGDRFVLLTDAMAAWYLRGYQEYQDQVLRFEGLLMRGEQDAITDLVAHQRTVGALRNDDIGIVMISARRCTKPGSLE